MRLMLAPTTTTDSLPVPVVASAAPPVEREKLSVLLKRLAAEFAERPMDFEELVIATQGRAYDVLLIFLSLPFLTPVPLPGLSTALGAVMVLIGARLAAGQRPWLPQRVRSKRVEGKILLRVLNGGSKVLSWLEIFLRPRFSFVHTTWVFQRITGVLIVISGALLMAPLPIPFSNILPAATVLLLAAGALERDGLFFFAGCLLFVVDVVFFSAIYILGMESVSWLLRAAGWGGA
jgi:hypothetical protein